MLLILSVSQIPEAIKIIAGKAISRDEVAFFSLTSRAIVLKLKNEPSTILVFFDANFGNSIYLILFLVVPSI